MANTSTSPQPGRSGAGFLFLLGFCLVAAGVGFATAPHYSWQVTKIARQAAALGVENGLLVVGGLILFGLGIVARSFPAGVPAGEPREDDRSGEELHLLNEQVSAKFSQMRTALLQLAEGQRALAAQHQTLIQKVNEPPVQEPSHNNNQDAIFRLAASLDKLNAHFDERFHGIDLQLRSGLEALAGEIRRGSGAPQRSAPAPVPARQDGPRGHHQAPQQAPEGTIDFYETMQKLDAIAGEAESGGRQPRPQNPPAPFASQGEATLDSLLPEEYR